MDLTKFKKITIPLFILTLTGNLLLLLLSRWSINNGQGKISFIALIFLFSFNMIMTFLTWKLISKRLEFLTNTTKRKNFWKISWMVFFPLFGLFFLLKMFKDDKSMQNNLSHCVKFSTLYAVITGVIFSLFHAPFHSEIQPSNIIYNSLFYYQLTPSFKYVSNIIHESNRIFNFKDNIHLKYPDRKIKDDYIFKKVQEEYKEKRVSTLGVILWITVEQAFFTSHDLTKKKKPVNRLVGNLSRHIDYLKMLCNTTNLVYQSIPFGIELLTGSMEIPIVLLIDIQLNSRLIIKLTKINENILIKIKKHTKDRDIASVNDKMDSFKKSTCFRSHWEIANFF